MLRTSTIFGVVAVAAVALGGCQQIGEWTGRYTPRQPEVAGAASLATRLSAALSGTNEVPVNFSYARGSAALGYDQASGTLSWSVTYENLTGEVAGAHLHGPAVEGENAGVQVNIGEAGLDSPIQGSGLITPEQASDLLGGLWYVNIHSSTYPDGEIRGQVTPGM